MEKNKIKTILQGLKNYSDSKIKKLESEHKIGKEIKGTPVTKRIIFDDWYEDSIFNQFFTPNNLNDFPEEGQTVKLIIIEDFYDCIVKSVSVENFTLYYIGDPSYLHFPGVQPEDYSFVLAWGNFGEGDQGMFISENPVYEGYIDIISNGTKIEKIDSKYIDYSPVSGFLPINNPQGQGSFSMNGQALGEWSQTLGLFNTVTGSISIAQGYNLHVSGSNSVQVGKRNFDNEDAVFMVGAGTGVSMSEQKNALEVSNDRDLWIQNNIYVGGNDQTFDKASSKRVATLDELCEVFGSGEIVETEEKIAEIDPQRSYSYRYIDYESGDIRSNSKYRTIRFDVKGFTKVKYKKICYTDSSLKIGQAFYDGGRNKILGIPQKLGTNQDDWEEVVVDIPKGAYTFDVTYYYTDYVYSNQKTQVIVIKERCLPKAITSDENSKGLIRLPITGNGTTANPYSIDKTFQEIYDLCQNHDVEIYDNTGIYRLNQFTGEEIAFIGLGCVMSGTSITTMNVRRWSMVPLNNKLSVSIMPITSSSGGGGSTAY